MKTPNSKLEYCQKDFQVIIIKIITNKGLKYLTLHEMSLYNILVSPFKLNYWNKWTFCTIFSFFEFHLCIYNFQGSWKVMQENYTNDRKGHRNALIRRRGDPVIQIRATQYAVLKMVFIYKCNVLKWTINMNEILISA